MGIGGIGIWQLLIVLVIVLLLFGTKRLKGLGGDLGGAIKGFKKAIGDEDATKDPSETEADGTPKKVTDADKTTADVKQEAPKDTAKSETKQY